MLQREPRRVGGAGLRHKLLLKCVLCVALLACGCATYNRQGLDLSLAEQIENTKVRRNFNPGSETRQKIIALDPERVTEQEIREVLSQAPAPRITNIHD